MTRHGFGEPNFWVTSDPAAPCMKKAIPTQTVHWSNNVNGDN